MPALELARLAVTLIRARLASATPRAGERGQVVPQWIYITAISVAAAAAIGAALYAWMRQKATDVTST